MRKINLKDVPEAERKSPSGKFLSYSKNVSIALGRDQASTDLLKRHPFDLAVTRIPPGAKRCPYHSHSAQWEFYVVISGVGKIRDSAGITEVSPGDAFFFGPNEAHQMINDGKEDFIYYVIADNPVGDFCHYPDSDKWAFLRGSEGVILKGREVDYFEGED
jgi:uncharacterized cupin superfamily protein